MYTLLAPSSLSRHIAAALFAVLLALALPQVAGAQPILVGKALAAPQRAPSLWQPVSGAFAAPGRDALQISLAGARVALPALSFHRAPAPLSPPAIERVAPAVPWPHLLLP